MSLDRACILSIICSGLICATTYHAGDFKDIEGTLFSTPVIIYPLTNSNLTGDRLVGRRTIPIEFPTSSRPTLMLALVAWTVCLSILWKLSDSLSIVFALLGWLVGQRFVMKTSCKDDQRSCYLYYVSSHYSPLHFTDRGLIFSPKVWLSFAHALPAYARFE